MTNPIAVTEANVPKVLIEFLVYGENKDDEQIKNKLKKLQELMANSKKANTLRILWLFDRDKTNEEKKQWLIDNAVCRYYVFVGENDVISKDFVKDKLLAIKKLECAVDNCKANGLIVKK